MADLTPAKAGDKISDVARRALADASRVNLDAHDRNRDQLIPAVVEPKTPGLDGQWFCITCGYLPRHNMDAWNHASNGMPGKCKVRRFAWRNFTTGKIEEP